MADSTPKIPLIDPTLNVKELVKQNEEFRNSLREADMAFNQMAREKDDLKQDLLRKAESRRQNDLAAQKAAFDLAQATTLRLQVENNAALFLASMDRMALGVNDRLAKLEQFRYESSGKGSGASSVMAYVVTFISVAIATVSVAIAIFRH